jgi:hypothetical protein
MRGPRQIFCFTLHAFTLHLKAFFTRAALMVPGGSPGAGDFHLRGQERSHQREGRPGESRLTASPVLLDEPGGCGTRALYPGTMRIRRVLMVEWRTYAKLAQSSPTTPGSPVLLGVSQGGMQNERRNGVRRREWLRPSPSPLPE